MKTLSIMILSMVLLSGPVAFGDGTGYVVGDKASDFKLKNIDGKFVSLADYQDAKGFVVVFTCNHCPYAKAYESRIIDLNNKYSPKGFPVIAINPNDPAAYPEDNFENMQKRAKDKGFTFPYLVDEEQKVYPIYGATRTPHVYILSKSGSELTVEYIGAIDNNYENPAAVTEKYAEAAIDALLSGSKPSVTSTKAVGCSIKARQK